MMAKGGYLGGKRQQKLRCIIHEQPLTLERVRISIKKRLFKLICFWTLIRIAVLDFLITVNSSVNFFIYCFRGHPKTTLTRRGRWAVREMSTIGRFYYIK